MQERSITRAVKRAERGASLDAAECTALLSARGSALEELSRIAGSVRDAGLREVDRVGQVTYSPKVFIPLTRLCRDRCHYCTFATDPASLRRAGQQEYLTPDEVLRIAAAGAALGCTEALFTLGDTPEDRWPQAQRWLHEGGYDTTVDYLRASAIAVLEGTGVLPHLNPGVLDWQDLRRLRPVAPSMGLMLESSSDRLFSVPGQVHYGSPDKDPKRRLRMITDAGRLNIPFTTGILVGIGETDAEVVDSLFAIRSIHRQFRHIQEVLVQNFRAKPDTAARERPDADPEAHVAVVAVARLILGPAMRIQVPPNLSDTATLLRLIAAGADDLGGISPVTVDHVNPERPWPQIAALESTLADAGWGLTARLTAHPSYVQAKETWMDPRVHPHVCALAGADGLKADGVLPRPLRWQEEDPSYAEFAARSGGGRVSLARDIDSTGRWSVQRGDGAAVYGDWGSVAEQAVAAGAPRMGAQGNGHGGRNGTPGAAPGKSLPRAMRSALALALRNPAALSLVEHQDEALTLMQATGESLDALCELANDVRRDVVGDAVTYVINRNLNFTNVCYTGCRFCAFAQRESDADSFTLSATQVGDRVDEAAARGATEICMQGGIHPDLPGEAYFDLARVVKQRQPAMHLHAFSPMEVANGATRSGMSIRAWLEEAKVAGVDSLPGTAAEILDDDVRWVLTKGKLPTAAWVDVITTAHEVGLPTSATMMYGHVDRPQHWVSHLRLLRELQMRTGGFTEFVPLPFIHQQSPIYLAGVARPGPTQRDNRAVHAMARLMLYGAIDHIQCSWVKLGREGCALMLRSGADDLGGTLMEETISRMAGSDHGSSMEPHELVEIAALAGREAVQRTTRYAQL